MAWILLATLGQFLNAVVAFLDKYIVSDEKAMPRPFVYAFYSCLFTGGWMVIYVLGYIPGLAETGVPHLNNVSRPSLEVVSMSFLSAYTLFIALVSLYSALQKAEAVNVMPVVGAISALASFGLSVFLLEVVPTTNFMWGVLVLSLGTLLVAQTLPKIDTIVQVFHSGLFFALHYVVMKGLFETTNFDDGFFWSRVGLVLFSLSLLLVPAYFSKIRAQTSGVSRRSGVIVILTKILAGIAAFMILKATDWGDVAVVQALDGVKFVFILLISFFFGSLLPDSAVEHITKPREVMRRLLYVLVIAVGYFILFI